MRGAGSRAAWSDRVRLDIRSSGPRSPPAARNPSSDRAGQSENDNNAG